MSLLNLDSDNALKIIFKGVEYNVRQASIGEVHSFNKKLKEENADEFDLTIELIEKIGVPKEISMEMSSSQFQSLVSFIIGKDEKKS
jgi:hypothetical protein